MIEQIEKEMKSRCENRMPWASIIISSYNYSRFLKQCIESALSQTYPQTEVIVIDDGSSDGSAEIIAGYGDKIKSIIKTNGGQASVFNLGLRISRGKIILFLDSDDLMMPSVVKTAVELFQIPDTVKVHWPLWFIDEKGVKTGKAMHQEDLAEGDLREALIQGGPGGYNWPSTSGNAWSRVFLEEIFPIPEKDYRIGPDTYISAFAPLFGTVRKISEPQGCYRIHGANNTYKKPFEQRLRFAIERWNRSFHLLGDYCKKMGITVQQEQWKKNSWWHQVALAVTELDETLPAGDPFILVDSDEWVSGGLICGRKTLPLVERDGQFWGPPEDDETAIRELERLRKGGTKFLVIAWPAFWWLKFYKEWNEYLRSNYRCLLSNDRFIIFDLCAAN